MASSNAQQSDAKPALRKPVFVKVDQLKPGTNGHTLIVKVLNANAVLQKGKSVSQHLRQTRISECLVGDETASILSAAPLLVQILLRRLGHSWMSNPVKIQRALASSTILFRRI